MLVAGKPLWGTYAGWDQRSGGGVVVDNGGNLREFGGLG